MEAILHLPTGCRTPQKMRQPGFGLGYCIVSVTVPISVRVPEVPVTVTV